ncbi:MAG: HAD hydrolase family protein [Planctomycetes bacterium]|nr:HAD hydrolase family protein [Planctomycetota bacterium]
MKKTDFKNIQLLVLDVDGVLTNGAIVINNDGSETKFFNSLDGHGIKMWQRAGLKVAVLSGRFSEPTKQRAEQLGIENCIQGCLDKIGGLKKLLEELGLSAEQVAYIGDDLPDLPPIKYVGFGAAVANAVDEVKQYADYVTKNNGGSGAVREVIELILKSTGQWQQLLKKYLPE